MINSEQHNTQPMAVSFAQACLSRLAAGEPETKAGYKFDKSEYSYELENARHHLAKNIYRTATGEVCTLTEAATQLQLSETRTTELFSRYCNRWSIVYKNHGINGVGNKFKTADGIPSTLKDLSEIYGYSEASISRHFSKVDGDYIKANKILKELADKRAESDACALERMRSKK